MGQCRSSKADSPQILSNGTGKYRLRRNSGFVLLEESTTSAVAKPDKLCAKRLKCDKRENSSSTLMVTENDDAKVIIRKSLLRSGVFSDQINQLHLTSHDIDRIVDAFHVEHYDEDQLLFQKDDFPSEKMYIVRSGIFRGVDNWVCKTILRENDIFGELDFFHQNARHLSVSVLGSNASTYCLNKRDFKIIVERGRDLNNIRIFDSLSEVQKYSVKDQVKLSNYIRGDIPLRKNAAIPYFYIVLSGQIAVSTDSNPPPYSSGLAVPQSEPFNTNSSAVPSKGSGFSQSCSTDDDTLILSPGEYFGEESLILGIDKSSRSYMAINEVTLCLVSKTLFHDVETFLPAKNFIINDLKVRDDEKLVRGIRKKKSSVRFSLHGEESSCKRLDSATNIVTQSGLSANSISPKGILLTAASVSILSDTDNSSNTDSNVTVDFVPVRTNEDESEFEYSDMDSFFFCGVL